MRPQYSFASWCPESELSHVLVKRSFSYRIEALWLLCDCGWDKEGRDLDTVEESRMLGERCGQETQVVTKHL